MNLLVGILLALLALPALASNKMTAVTIAGASYVQIQDVHIVSGGRIVLLYASGGTTVTADQLPRDFLDSWGITAQAVAESKRTTDLQTEQSLEQAIRGGFFREVDGVIYDLRKPQAGWIRFAGAKILQIVENGALIDPAPGQGVPATVFVRNLPHIFTDNQSASFMAKLTGNFSYINRFGYEQTIRAYDVGHICARNEIPSAIIKEGHTAARVGPSSEPSGGQEAAIPDRRGLRGIGSGFFVTQNGYLLTNYHVVKEAGKIKVYYKKQYYPAKVIDVDRVNDVALLKVDGGKFLPLALSHKSSADLGDEVFTIGFPNIEMQGVEPKYTDGKISSLAGMQDDPTEYQISVPVQPGNSGGPLCDVNGEVVGIVVARLNDMAVMRVSGVVPQNVNYAVKSEYALRLVESTAGLEPLLAAAQALPKPAKPVQAVENAIAMVLINQ
ncbi:MAG TPA: serine protease [Candidatus Saccharimonadales bacterium]|nr:serine protease [Candidatus Saccharimonadales bacterium]